MTTIESERDFYFEKLRGIEVMLQVYKEKEESGELLWSPRGSGGGEMKRVIEKIFRVMYAAAEDNVVVDDEGNVSSVEFVWSERCIYLFLWYVCRSYICVFA